MSFVFALQTLFPDSLSENDISEWLLELEEALWRDFPYAEYEISETEILLYNPEFIDAEGIFFKNYSQEWAAIKNFLIRMNWANDANYKNFFKIKKIDFQNNEILNAEKMDSLLAVVDKNDPKLLDVLQKIQKIQKNQKT